MSTKILVLLAVLFIVATVVAYQVAAWQMTPKHRVGGADTRSRIESLPATRAGCSQRAGSVMRGDAAHYFLFLRSLT